VEAIAPTDGLNYGGAPTGQSGGGEISRAEALDRSPPPACGQGPENDTGFLAGMLAAQHGAASESGTTPKPTLILTG